MERIKLTQASIVASDLEAATKDFEEIFGMKFAVVVNEELRLKLAFSDQGLTLVAAL